MTTRKSPQLATSNTAVSQSSAALIDLVIDRITSEKIERIGGYRCQRVPMRPTHIDALTFPNEKPVSPSLKRWLAFDLTFLKALGWFKKRGNSLVFAPQSFSQFASKQYGEDMRETFEFYDRILPGGLYLLPLGADSRRALYVGEPDSLGEYPVLFTDIDEDADVGVMYPGFDVFMAEMTGVLTFKGRSYSELFTHQQFRPRMLEQAKKNLFGKRHVAMFDAIDRSEKMDKRHS